MLKLTPERALLIGLSPLSVLAAVPLAAAMPTPQVTDLATSGDGCPNGTVYPSLTPTGEGVWSFDLVFGNLEADSEGGKDQGAQVDVDCRITAASRRRRATVCASKANWCRATTAQSMTTVSRRKPKCGLGLPWLFPMVRKFLASISTSYPPKGSTYAARARKTCA